MKKNRIFLSFLILILFTVFLSVTCKQNIGLGGTIDIERPEGEITYPDAGETPIRGSFVMKGYARDDDGIKSITISFKNIETKEIIGPHSVGGFTEGDGSVSWSINIDNESKGVEAPPHELVKKYPIPDGEYTAILTVTDKGGRTYETTKNYKIDNTPPIFIVQRPSTVINENAEPSASDQADGYGAVFSVVGQAGEKNTVEKLNVHVPGTPPIDMTNMFVSNSINAQVAVSKVVSGSETDPLYGLQELDKTKPIKGALYLYDNAREYKGGNASGEGNKADWYYQWDDIHTYTIAKDYTPAVISDYFAGKRGSDANEHDKKIKALRNDLTALTKLKEKMVKMSEKRSTFKLDPSKSPGFKVIGVTNLPDTTSTPLNISQASSLLFKPGNETTFLVELIRNKDNTPVVGGSDLVAYKASNIEIVLLKWDGTGDAANCFKTDTHLIEKSLVKFSTLSNTNNITVTGGNLRVKCKFDTTWGEGYYAVKVRGTDTIDEPSHKFQEYDDSNTASGGFYIINFLTTGSGPRIRPIRPQGVKNTTLDIEADVRGIDSTGVVYYSIDTPVSTSPYPTTVLTKVNPSDPNDFRYKAANVNISGLDDKIHTIYFLAKAGPGSTDSDTTDFTVDKTAPTVTIRYPAADDPQAGDITISGAISDDPPSGLTPEPPTAGVKASSTKYILGKKTSVPTVSTPDYDAATAPHGWKAMDSSTKGSWNVRVNLDQVPPAEYGAVVGAYRKIPLYIFTEDEIGNKTVRELEILFNPDGTKPVVKILSPQPDVTVGGTIQIFGTASAVIGGPGAVGEVYIQFSHDGNFNSAADGTFGGFTPPGGTFIPSKDWYNGGNGQLVPGTSLPGGGADWRVSINSDGSFNHATAQNQPVYFRVRAKNKDGITMGEWTEKRKIIVDKDAPLITDIKIDNASGASSPQDYELNMWLKSGKKLTAKLTDPSGIQDVKITFKNGTVETKYQKKAVGTPDSGYTAVPSGWLTDYTSGSISGYTLDLPLDISSMSGDSFSVTIEVKEKASQQLSSNSSFLFRFDTKNPVGDYGVDKHMNIGNFTSSSIMEAQLAQKVRDLGGTASSGGGCKIVAGNSVLTVTKVTGNTVEFTASPTLTGGSYSYILYKPELLIYEGSSGDWIINGVANDSGSGVKEVKAKVVVNGTSSPEITMTETDPQNRITKQLGGTVTWQGKIDLAPTPPVTDGKGKLYYTITDNSGNTYSHSVDVHVKNKPIMVSAITLSTDIGGTPSSFAGGLSGALNANRDFIGKVTSTEFAFKNKDNSKIKVEFTGGQGTVKYRLKKGDDTTELQSLTTITSGSEIDLKNHLTAIGNSNGTPIEIILELWDEAHGFAVGTDTAFAKITIKTLFDALDTKSPTVVVQPFHWNKEDDNSLYQNSRANGHVEIDTSSVSGKVTLRGFAYDNVKIDTITAVLPFSSALTVTATRSGQTWSSDKTMTSNGVELKVIHLGADYLGYYVKWELSFDSSKIPMGADKDIKVTANDGVRNSVESGAPISMTLETVTRGAENSASHSSFTSANIGQFVLFETGQKRYLTRISSKNGNIITLDNSIPTDMNQAAVYDYSANKTKTSVKSVPYITSLARESRYNTNRSTSGAYNLLRGDKFTVTGFNLGGTGATVKAIIPDGTTNGSAITISSGAFTLPATAKSGKIKITVKPSGSATEVEAINNNSNNNKPYNRQEIANRPETAYWTDDLTIDVWKDDEAFEGSDNPKYPSMAMGSNGDLYAAFSNYSDASVFYSKIGTGTSSLQKAFHAYDQPEEAAISVTGTDTVNILYSANYHGGYPANWKSLYSGAGGLYCYDKNAHGFDYDWGRITGKFYRFELFYHNKQLQQFKNFRLARKSNRIHIAYYDTLANSIKYSTVDASSAANGDLLNDRHEIAWVDLDGGNDIDVETDIQLKRVGTVAKLVNSQFESLTRTGSTAEYCAIALDGSNKPVVVYADVDTGTLRLARASSATPTAASDWKVQKVLPTGDDNEGLAEDYFAAQFDSEGYLHIVFRNTRGQICYVKSKEANQGANAYTFGKSIVIAENGSWVELTMDGKVPYIAYLRKTNTYDGIQIVYYDANLVKTWNSDGSEGQKGAWNIMTAAMRNRAGAARACIAVAPASVTNWKAAVGYTPGGVYRVVKYIGN
ncbi:MULTISPECIES: hypothetical protein [Treponema]|uniref:hypothetical protein n=1 Tax=Treponema TaxID=157 RepID=UPI0002B57F22|nr:MULTISPECIES: hypothetical protein [Treponema]EMB47314.1 hypothetical protein HMPREF9729_00796 [Treponema denticola ASLM]EMD55671.1 hypothetical protein HMPREF9728_02570 [Treponema denticola US-Trep]UTD09040.1 hypothetical protein HYB91_00370 [Treponema sp. B152]